MNSIKNHFSKTVNDYDTVVDKVVFKNDELHNELINAIFFDKDKELNILDLGCGTGHGMKIALERFAKAKITGVDFSPIMIEKAKNNLLSFSQRVKLLEANFNNYEFDQKYDAVISAIAIHNCTHDEKRELFKKIFDSLNNGGLFINADFYEHDSVNLNNELKNIYRDFLKQNLEGEELDAWIKHAFEEDMPMTLSQQSLILKEIGFSSFKLIWIFNNEAVYIAKK